MDDESGLLVGRDPTTAKRLLAVAVLVFAAVFVLITPADILGFEIPFPPNLWTLFLLMVTLPVVWAFVNDGLLVSIALAAGPPFGFYVPMTLFDVGNPSESVVWGLGVASTFTLPLGLIGFAVGVGLRRLIIPVQDHL